jgi:hypothetical protein
MLRLGVYHLLPMCHVYTDIITKFSTSELGKWFLTSERIKLPSFSRVKQITLLGLLHPSGLAFNANPLGF